MMFQKGKGAINLLIINWGWGSMGALFGFFKWDG